LRRQDPSEAEEFLFQLLAEAGDEYSKGGAAARALLHHFLWVFVTRDRGGPVAFLAFYSCDKTMLHEKISAGQIPFQLGRNIFICLERGKNRQPWDWIAQPRQNCRCVEKAVAYLLILPFPRMFLLPPGEVVWCQTAHSRRSPEGSAEHAET